jgi:hypothetical protein
MSSDIFESTGTPEDLYGLDAAETYKANSVISLSFSDGSSCSATVLKAFLPPTQSLVLLVNVEGCATVTNPAILKIHDSRFMESRDGAGSDYRPWSLELEIMAVERRDAITRGERDDDYDAVGWMDDPLLFEEHLHRAAKTAFETECEVYKRLRDLQGIGIPRCYATGTVTYGSLDGIRARPVHPPFLLLEYCSFSTKSSSFFLRDSLQRADSLRLPWQSVTLFGGSDRINQGRVYLPMQPWRLSQVWPSSVRTSHVKLIKSDARRALPKLSPSPVVVAARLR